jgi:molybdopterin-guanine dinucleotide biosynthesis protein A
MMPADLYGVVLSGGHSRRMHSDKASLSYQGKPQLTRAIELLAPLVSRSFISIRQDQLRDPLRSGYETIVDRRAELGPIAGIDAALAAHPDKAWLVLACDLPFLDRGTLERLIAGRDPARLATAYRSSSDGLPEPLCAIFEPASRAAVERWIEQGERCPRTFLLGHHVALLDLTNPRALDNINMPDEYTAAHSAAPPVEPRGQALSAGGIASSPSESDAPVHRVRVQYFAVLREQAGRSAEELETKAQTAIELYRELRHLRGLGLPPERLRVAVNEEFGDWHSRLTDGDTVAFLPPVAGG